MSFSSEAMEAGAQYDDIFKVLKESFQETILYLENLSSKNEGQARYS